MNGFVRYWLPLVGYCTIIFVQSSFPTPEQLPSFKFSDKVQHIIAYAILGILFCRAFNTVHWWRHRWGLLFLFGVVATTAYGLSDEWHQSFVKGRNADAADVIADFVGGLIGCWLYVMCVHLCLRRGAS